MPPDPRGGANGSDRRARPIGRPRHSSSTQSENPQEGFDEQGRGEQKPSEGSASHRSRKDYGQSARSIRDAIDEDDASPPHAMAAEREGATSRSRRDASSSRNASECTAGRARERALGEAGASRAEAAALAEQARDAYREAGSDAVDEAERWLETHGER